MIRSLAVVLAVMVTLAWAAGASAEMKEGLWEITTKAEMKGMPSNQMPASTTKQCFTKKDAVPQPEKKDPNTECKMKDQKIVGDTVTYTMECKAKDGTMVTVSGKATYKGDVFDGSSVTTIKSKEQGTMQMTSKMSGKYLGPCSK